MILSFSKINHLHGQPYRVFTSDETNRGTATVHCRDETTGKLLEVDLVEVLIDDDFAGKIEDVLNEYEHLRRRNKID